MSDNNSTKTLWITFFILLGLTVGEVVLGIFKFGLDTITLGGISLLNYIFLILTLIKAYFIVATFMHLGGEKKGFQYAIYLPVLILIPYLTFILLAEGAFTFSSSEGIY